MKKITLVLIIVFTLIVGAIFIGSANPSKTNSTIQNPIVKKVNNNSKNKVNIFNDIDINISQLKPNVKTYSADTFTINEVSKHNTKNNCYLIINNKVYDVSDYISYHPGGSRTIISRCGKEVTGIFARIHSNRAWDLLKKYKIGTITITITITTNKPNITPQILRSIENALKDANPGVDVIKVSPKQDFYISKVIFNNKLYEIHINNSGKIIKEEVEDAESDWSIWENDKDDK